MGAATYVVGLRPACLALESRRRGYENGTLRVLASGKTVDFALEFGATREKEEIAAPLG